MVVGSYLKATISSNPLATNGHRGRAGPLTRLGLVRTGISTSIHRQGRGSCVRVLHGWHGRHAPMANTLKEPMSRRTVLAALVGRVRPAYLRHRVYTGSTVTP